LAQPVWDGLHFIVYQAILSGFNSVFFLFGISIAPLFSILSIWCILYALFAKTDSIFLIYAWVSKENIENKNNVHRQK